MRTMVQTSAYPFAPLETLAEFRHLPFRQEVLEKVLGGNAMSLLTRIGALTAPEEG